MALKKKPMKSRSVEEREDISILTKKIPELEQQYKEFFEHKTSKEPKGLRKELEVIINKYTKKPFINTVNKYKFQTLLSKYNLRRAMWDKKLRELAIKEVSGEFYTVSDVEKKYLDKIIDQF